MECAGDITSSVTGAQNCLKSNVSAEDQQKHIAICKGEKKKTKTLLFHFMLRFPFSFPVIKNSSYQLQPKCHFIYSTALTRAAHGGSVLQ